MLRVLLFLVLALAIAALIFRRPALRRALWAALVLVAVYGVLKATGVVDALAPAETGVF
jgi:hypothetical protein